MSLGIPYMGSKRKIAKPLIDYMLNRNPNAKYFYDLFGGGGAMSFEAVKRKRFKKVYYNEFNEAIVNLLIKIKADGVTSEFYEWIDRETFYKYKDGKCWKSGLIKTCWSFGNNQRSYLFGSDIEEKKRLLHEIIVNRCNISRLEFEKLTGLFIDDYYLRKDDIQDRRLEVMKIIKSSLGRNDMQQLQQLQQLEQLERLQIVQQLEITNLSYEEVKIETPINETIVYCDPPYKGTGKYQKDIDHDKFLEWVKNSPYKIYVSSYEFELPCVFELSHRSSLSVTNNNKKVVEKLFCNQEELAKGTLF
jgi:site-specific DNA-adenine methylase